MTKPAVTDEVHHFDRRATDVNYRAVTVRLKALEDHVFDVLTPMVEKGAHEIEANTALTEETHGWTAELREGMTERREQTAEMYEVFVLAKNGVRVIGKIGDGIMWAADRSSRLAKPLGFLAILAGAAWHFLSGGGWHWPK